MPHIGINEHTRNTSSSLLLGLFACVLVCVLPCINNTVAFISVPYLASLLFINHRQFVICLFTHLSILGKLTQTTRKKCLKSMINFYSFGPKILRMYVCYAGLNSSFYSSVSSSYNPSNLHMGKKRPQSKSKWTRKKLFTTKF